MKNSNDCKEKSESIDLKESNRTKCSKLLGFLSLFSIAMFLSIGSPYLWSRILRKNFDPTIESDLRYDCFPLRPTLRPNRTNCNTNVCLWDHFASPSEISCYYRMENANDLFRDHLRLIPRYIVSEKIDRFHFKLRMHTPPPFYRNQSNENTNNNNNNNNNPSNINAFNDYDGQISSSIPEPYEYLSLSIHHYNREHFSVLIKPEEEGEKIVWDLESRL
ncbi:hypothetical protein QR98_0025680 [Sarcoptes scabiei]|uniref:Uncharacterized protein n=1 Tax=Sarcoptes scabiei TaxID=52283 RepID=A0A131ZZ38_SARSC|nr:hypothetical protein QR98_0025680 [Sarcoptes scabiei]